MQKITQNSLAYSTNCIIPQSFWGSGMWKWLSWVVLTHVLLQGCRQAVSWGCGHRKASLGLENPTPRPFLPFLAVRSSSPCGCFHRLSEWPRDMAAASLRERDPRERESSKEHPTWLSQPFRLILEVSCHLDVLGSPEQPGHNVGGDHTGCEYLGVGHVGG